MTASSWTTTPAPLRGGRLSCHTAGGPLGRRPRAFRSLLRSAAARQGRATTLRARSAWSMELPRALGAEALAGASAAAAVPDTRDMVPYDGPAVPGGTASGCTGPASSSATGPARGGGGAVLLAWPGAPRLPSPPRLGPPCGSPVHAPPPPQKTLGARPPLALGHADPRTPKRPKPDPRLTRGGL